MSTYASTTATNGILLTTPGSPPPAGAPKGLIVTRAIETKDGWVGQIIVAEAIIWESHATKKAHQAERLATRRVIERIKNLFGDEVPLAEQHNSDQASHTQEL